MRRFHLNRVIDETGISGTGRVAEGVEFSNGQCALVWLTKHTSCAVYPSMDEVVAIHGHGGKTEIVYDEPVCLNCGHLLDAHWMDNCDGCFTAGCPCNLMERPEGMPGWYREMLNDKRMPPARAPGAPGEGEG